MKYFKITILFLIILIACKKDENKLIKNYFSCGVISTEVISHTSTQAVVKVKFFVLDKSNSDNLIKQDIRNNIIVDNNSSVVGTLDSIKRIVTSSNGYSSTAVLISDGLDETINMEDYINGVEPTIRKLFHTSVPNNEILLAKIGNTTKPIEIIGSGYTRNAEELDLPLARICKNINYEAADTLRLLEAIDSTINYMNAKSTYSNKNLLILYSRRKYFQQNLNLNTLINKAKQSNISCHIMELAPTFTYTNFALDDFLIKINTLTKGMYYEKQMYNSYSYDNGELPMEVLQVSGKLNEIFNGGFECFEAIWTINSKYSLYTSGKTFSYNFSIKLSTNFEQKEIDIPFNFYIYP